MTDPWWKSTVIYQIYPLSFADSNGDGIGDLEGIRRRLDHVLWLGTDTIWLSPFYPSPMRDAGYDVTDFCDVDPRFGTLDDADRLITEAHERGLRVLLDWVPNHTSDLHPWFREARSSRDSPKRDWYFWTDRPNNWRAAFKAGSAWDLDEHTDQYYLHFFLPEQPDLNWFNDDVVTAMHNTLRFWLDRGVDGFRIDSTHCMGKDPEFADDDRCLAGEPISSFNDQPQTHDVLRGLRRVVDSYPGDRLLLGEVNIRQTRRVVRYYGANDELHLSFNFPPLDAPWDSLVWRMLIREVEQQLSGETAWPVWVLSNHDNERLRTRYGGSLRRARAAAVLLLTLRGTVCIYQGDELGLEDSDLAPSQQTDPVGRDVARAPIPWDREEPHGWHGAKPWLPFSPDPAGRSVQAQHEDPGSIAHLYRRLIRARKESPALAVGTWEELSSPPGVLVYRRCNGDDVRTVLVNFTPPRPCGTAGRCVDGRGQQRARRPGPTLHRADRPRAGDVAAAGVTPGGNARRSGGQSATASPTPSPAFPPELVAGPNTASWYRSAVVATSPSTSGSAASTISRATPSTMRVTTVATRSTRIGLV